MSGYELGTGSYSSNPTDWKQKREDVQEEFNEGHTRSKELSKENNEVTDERNKTSYSIYNAKRENASLTSSYDNFTSIMTAIESGDIEQIKANPYLAKFVTGADISGALNQKGSIGTKLSDLMQQLKSGNLKLSDLQDLFRTQSKQKSSIETAFWQQQGHNMGLVDEMRFIDNMRGFEALG